MVLIWVVSAMWQYLRFHWAFSRFLTRPCSSPNFPTKRWCINFCSMNCKKITKNYTTGGGDWKIRLWCDGQDFPGLWQNILGPGNTGLCSSSWLGWPFQRRFCIDYGEKTIAEICQWRWLQENPGIQLINPTAAAATGEKKKAGWRYFTKIWSNSGGDSSAIHRRKIGGQSQSLALMSLSDDRTLSVGGLLDKLHFMWKLSLRSRYGDKYYGSDAGLRMNMLENMMSSQFGAVKLSNCLPTGQCPGRRKLPRTSSTFSRTQCACSKRLQVIEYFY